MGNSCCSPNHDALNISGKFYYKSKANYQDLVNQYDIDQLNLLGSGTYGKVYKASSIQDPTSKVAIKEMKK